MHTLTQCVDELKFTIQRLSTEPLSQNYTDLGDLIFPSEHTAIARDYATTLVSNTTTPNKSSLVDEYSIKALQCAWNIADIFAVALQYTPREWSTGFFRGLMAEGPNKSLNVSNLMQSIEYLNSNDFLMVPYIVDERTYQINRIFLVFAQEIQTIPNGASLLATIASLSKQFIGTAIELDQDVIKTAQQRISAYETYQKKLLHKENQTETLDETQIEDDATTTDEESSEEELETLACQKRELNKSHFARLERETKDNDSLTDDESDGELEFFDARTWLEDDEFFDTFSSLEELEEAKALKKLTLTTVAQTVMVLQQQKKMNDKDLVDPLSGITESVFTATEESKPFTELAQQVDEYITVLDSKPQSSWLQKIKSFFAYLYDQLHEFIANHCCSPRL